jgi:hypothetical protein
MGISWATRLLRRHVGRVAMLTSAPFDNWWHNAYGLDVKIVSLPHSILSLGEAMISFGAMLLVCAQVNRASGAYQQKLDRLLLFIGGVEIFGAALFALESTPIEFMHSSSFYRAIGSLIKIEAREARLLGLDMPTKVAVTDPGGGIPLETIRRVMERVDRQMVDVTPQPAPLPLDHKRQ